MENQAGWHEGNKPPQDGIYLVRVTPEEDWELGFGAHSPILVASYTGKDHLWAVHGAILPVHDFGENIIAWHELPPGSKN
jgi:hypothetical protein